MNMMWNLESIHSGHPITVTLNENQPLFSTIWQVTTVNGVGVPQEQQNVRRRLWWRSLQAAALVKRRLQSSATTGDESDVSAFGWSILWGFSAFWNYFSAIFSDSLVFLTHNLPLFFSTEPKQFFFFPFALEVDVDRPCYEWCASGYRCILWKIARQVLTVPPFSTFLTPIHMHEWSWPKLGGSHKRQILTTPAKHGIGNNSLQANVQILIYRFITLSNWKIGVNFHFSLITFLYCFTCAYYCLSPTLNVNLKILISFIRRHLNGFFSFFLLAFPHLCLLRPVPPPRPRPAAPVHSVHCER